jgi:hypothetical protein
VFLPYPGAESSFSPSIRIIEKNKAEWIEGNPVCELVDNNGKVIYSVDEIKEVLDKYISLGGGYKLFYGDRYKK